jgi:hypothetical protein
VSAQRLSYTCDLTDDVWQILAPLLAPEKLRGSDPVNASCVT